MAHPARRRGRSSSAARQGAARCIEFLRAAARQPRRAGARPAAPLQERRDQLVVAGAAPARLPLGATRARATGSSTPRRFAPVRDLHAQAHALPALRRLRSASPQAPITFGLSRDAGRARAQVASLIARGRRAVRGAVRRLHLAEPPVAAAPRPPRSAALLRARGSASVLVGGPADAAFASSGARPPAPATSSNLVGRTVAARGHRRDGARRGGDRSRHRPDAHRRPPSARRWWRCSAPPARRAPGRGGGTTWSCAATCRARRAICPRCPIGQLCMERITPAMVMERVEQDG